MIYIAPLFIMLIVISYLTSRYLFSIMINYFKSNEYNFFPLNKLYNLNNKEIKYFIYLFIGSLTFNLFLLYNRNSQIVALSVLRNFGMGINLIAIINIIVRVFLKAVRY